MMQFSMYSNRWLLLYTVVAIKFSPVCLENSRSGLKPSLFPTTADELDQATRSMISIEELAQKYVSKLQSMGDAAQHNNENSNQVH